MSEATSRLGEPVGPWRRALPRPLRLDIALAICLLLGVGLLCLGMVTAFFSLLFASEPWTVGIGGDHFRLEGPAWPWVTMLLGAVLITAWQLGRFGTRFRFVFGVALILLGIAVLADVLTGQSNAAIAAGLLAALVGSSRRAFRS